MALKQGGRGGRPPNNAATKDQPTLKNEVVGNEPTPVANNEESVQQTLDAPIEVVTDEKEGTMTHSQVMALIKQLDEKHTQEINSIRSELKNSRQVEVPTKGKAGSHIEELMDDYIEEPVIFFSFTTNHFIHGDFQNGKEIVCPGGRIWFKPVIRQIKRGASGEQVVSIASVKVQSKAQVEFLRKHSGYKIQFFEDLGQAKNVDAVWAAKLVAVHNQYAKMSEVQVVARCQELGLPILKSIPEMRRNLVEKIAKQERERETASARASMQVSSPLASGGVMISNTMDSSGLQPDDDGRLMTNMR